MKLAALMMVRNEAAIIADSVGHLLRSVGVDCLYIADNSSSDQTPRILRRLAAMDARVQLRAHPGPYNQAEAMNALLQEAVRDGADWLLPADADEFLWLPGAVLRERCAAAGAVSGFHLQVVNFVQLRPIRRDRPGGIETMVFRAITEGIPKQAHALVRSGVPFLATAYAPKLLLRASPALTLSWGQHEACGLAHALAPEPLADLLHAPIRARDRLDARAEAGRRFNAVIPDPELGWHLKDLVGLDRQGLDAQWRANSVGPRSLLQGRYRLDLRLRQAGRRIRSFRQQALLQQSGR